MSAAVPIWVSAAKQPRNCLVENGGNNGTINMDAYCMGNYNGVADLFKPPADCQAQNNCSSCVDAWWDKTKTQAGVDPAGMTPSQRCAYGSKGELSNVGQVLGVCKSNAASCASASVPQCPAAAIEPKDWPAWVWILLVVGVAAVSGGVIYMVSKRQ